MKKVELVLAAVSWIACELPGGAEKVVVCGWCVSMHEKHVESLSREQRHQANVSLDKHRQLYRQAAIEQVCFQ